MSVSAECLCVAPELVPHFWPVVRPLLQAAVDHNGDWTIEEIERGLADKMLLWVATDGTRVLAAAVTRLLQTKNGKVCQVVACAGKELNLWRSGILAIESYAKAEGCASVRLRGRPGWKRIFPEYRNPWIALEKRL